MNTGIEALTDKEKETLRLMARGHDAKSAASALALSVHTINERLRNARRKLDVTSSREAARILLESEASGGDKAPADDHENPVYEQIGDAPADAPTDDPPIANRGDKRALWIGGIAVMSAFALILALTLQGSAPEPAAPPESAALTAELAPIDEAHEKAAREWLALVDAEDWRASYEAAGKAFREPNTVDTWREASQMARGPLGAVTKREAISFNSFNAPPNGYTVVRFLTAFENRDAAIESVTLEREGEALKVVGYFIE